MNLTKDNIQLFYDNAQSALNFCNSIKGKLSTSAQGIIDSLGSLSINTGSEDIIVSAFGNYLSPDGFICGTCKDVVSNMNGGSMDYLIGTLESLMSALMAYKSALQKYESAVSHNNSVRSKLDGKSLDDYNKDNPDNKLSYQNTDSLLAAVNDEKAKCDRLLAELSGITFSSSRTAEDPGVSTDGGSDSGSDANQNSGETELPDETETSDETSMKDTVLEAGKDSSKWERNSTWTVQGDKTKSYNTDVDGQTVTITTTKENEVLYYSVVIDNQVHWYDPNGNEISAEKRQQIFNDYNGF
jgi:hypothetical protein